MGSRYLLDDAVVVNGFHSLTGCLWRRVYVVAAASLTNELTQVMYKLLRISSEMDIENYPMPGRTV